MKSTQLNSGEKRSEEAVDRNIRPDLLDDYLSIEAEARVALYQENYERVAANTKIAL